MATVGADVLAELTNLITAITGFKEDNENFIACKRYALSHFMHHTYPSISKTNVKQTINGLENRFYIHGQFDIHEAFKKQVEFFLKQEETFKANPEVEIEWSVLSLLTSLASDLSKLDAVPRLLSTAEDKLDSDGFDWGSYLREGLPKYEPSYDTDSDSFSSLSSSSCEDFVSANVDLSEGSRDFLSEPPQTSAADGEQTENEEILISEAVNFRIEQIYQERLKERDKTAWRADDIRKCNFANIVRNYELRTGGHCEELCMISEREVVEMIVHSLMTGNRIPVHDRTTVSFLANRTFQTFISGFQIYIDMMASFRSFIDAVTVSRAGVPIKSVVAKAYGSALRHHLIPYEVHLRNLGAKGLTLPQLQESVQICVPYIRGLWSVHRECVTNWGSEPAWMTTLRILSALHNGMIMSHHEGLEAAFTGMFLSCHAVIGDILDSLLSSTLPADPGHEFCIQKITTNQGNDCTFNILPYQEFSAKFPLVDIIAKKVEEAKASLSLIHVMNRHRNLKSEETAPSINESLYEALQLAFGSNEMKETSKKEVDLFHDMSLLYDQTFSFQIDSSKTLSSESLDFRKVPKWVANSSSHIPVYKVVEKALLKAVTSKVNVVRHLAVSILVDESKLARHLAMLRSVFLCNNASLLLPFTTVFFNEESCWDNSEYLTSMLRECVMVDFPDLADELTVELIPRAGGSAQFSIIDAIDSMSVHYEIPHPINLVITEETMRRYNGIFRVLLKLKWAHRLSNLRFPSKKAKLSVAARYVLHRVQILRFSYLADLNVIINYFMGQVAATLPKPCQEYTDIHDIIKDHQLLLERIHARCMLSEGDHNYELIFDNMIPICFDLRRMWVLDAEIQIITRLKHVENIYKTSHKRLLRIMSYLERETYVPLFTKIWEDHTVNSTYNTTSATVISKGSR